MKIHSYRYFSIWLSLLEYRAVTPADDTLQRNRWKHIHGKWMIDIKGIRFGIKFSHIIDTKRRRRKKNETKTEINLWIIQSQQCVLSDIFGCVANKGQRRRCRYRCHEGVWVRMMEKSAIHSNRDIFFSIKMPWLFYFCVLHGAMKLDIRRSFRLYGVFI